MSAHIRLNGVGLRLPIHHAGNRSLKKTLLSAAGRLARGGRNTVEVRALDNITLSIGGGERVALIGANGAGKTSLLRVLAGILEPARGQIRIDGSRHALLHPGQGMHPDLTGRENIRLSGLYHDLPRPALARLEQDVADFAGLGDFLDLPLRTYSAGMAVRLGFAISTAMRPDILLMDEWFLAGDAAFLARARERLAAMVRRSDILVLASHQDEVLREWCARAIWLDQGRLRADGPVAEVIAAYRGGN